MFDLLKDSIEQKSFFVAGADAWFRNKNDPVALSAIKDAEILLSRLPADLDVPSVHAGTTNDPETVLSFLWWGASASGIHCTEIRCIGNGLYGAFWRAANGHKVSENFIPLERLESLNPSQVIRDLSLTGKPPVSINHP